MASSRPQASLTFLTQKFMHRKQLTMHQWRGCGFKRWSPLARSVRLRSSIAVMDRPERCHAFPEIGGIL